MPILHLRQRSKSVYRSGINARLTGCFQPVNQYHNFQTPESIPVIVLPITRKLSTSIPSTPDTPTVPSEQTKYETITETAADYLQTFNDAISFDILPWSATLPLVVLSLRLITFQIVY